jgi:hypothetical protein
MENYGKITGDRDKKTWAFRRVSEIETSSIFYTK